MDAVTTNTGRSKVEDMTDRALLEEAVTRMRNTQDMVDAFIVSMEKNPMMAMAAKFMSGGKNGR